MKRKKNFKNNKKNNKNKKFNLFQKAEIKFSKSCPLSVKGAPIIDYKNIKNLGNIGDIVNVKRGHGRNFLIKYGKALIASKLNIDLVNKKKAKLNEKNVSLKKEAKKLFEIINKKNYKFSKNAKDNNELYGSIKPKEISTKIQDLDKIEIKPSQIDLVSEINKLGTYQSKINLHPDIQAVIHIEVVKEEEQN